MSEITVAAVACYTASGTKLFKWIAVFIDSFYSLSGPTPPFAGWAKTTSRLKYQPVITGYFHSKKHNFVRLLMDKINKFNPEYVK